MHPNKTYHDADALRNLGFARERAFGVLVVNGDDGPLVSHVPFVLSEKGDVVDLHLVRSNPIARSLKVPLKAKIAISCGDSYISPNWYGIEDQVPTWNYVAVHLTGEMELRPKEELRDFLDTQTGFFEEQLLPKTPWKTKKMTPNVLDKMMRQIVPCRMIVTGVDGTWKLSQNKPEPVRLRAADGVEVFGIGSEKAVLAVLMRGAKSR